MAAIPNNDSRVVRTSGIVDEKDNRIRATGQATKKHKGKIVT